MLIYCSEIGARLKMQAPSALARLAGAHSGTRCTYIVQLALFETRGVAGAPQNAFPARPLACVSASSAGRSSDGDAEPAKYPDPW